MTKKAARIIASKRKEIAALDDEFFGKMGGVAQAIGELRKALNHLGTMLRVPALLTCRDGQWWSFPPATT